MAVRAADRVELVPAENLKDQVPVPAPAENLQAPVPVPEDNPEDPEVAGSLAASAVRVAVLAVPVSSAADPEAVVVLVAAALAVVGLAATSPFVVPRAVSGPDQAETEAEPTAVVVPAGLPIDQVAAIAENSVVD